MREFDDLIGRKFKRNIYGLSDWTKTVDEVFVVWECFFVDEVCYMKPKLKIKPKEYKGICYNLEEIVFL